MSQRFDADGDDDGDLPISDSGTHGAFTGDHQHAHAAPGGDSHNHMHSHDGDGDHGHAHGAAQMQEQRMTSTTDQAKTFEEQIAALRAENAALRQASEASTAAATAAKQMAERLALEAQTKRFTDEILGRSEQNGTRWVLGATTPIGADGASAIEKQIGILRTLASTFGEESEEFQAYVAQQRSMAETVRHADTFRQYGQPGGGDPASAESRIAALARQYAERDPQLTREQAMVRAMEENPELYQQAERERLRRIKQAD